MRDTPEYCIRQSIQFSSEDDVKKVLFDFLDARGFHADCRHTEVTLLGKAGYKRADVLITIKDRPFLCIEVKKTNAHAADAISQAHNYASNSHFGTMPYFAVFYPIPDKIESTNLGKNTVQASRFRFRAFETSRFLKREGRDQYDGRVELPCRQDAEKMFASWSRTAALVADPSLDEEVSQLLVRRHAVELSLTEAAEGTKAGILSDLAKIDELIASTYRAALEAGDVALGRLLNEVPGLRVSEQIGKGIHATVFRGQHHAFGKVAVKILQRRFVHDLIVWNRFEREVEVLKQLSVDENSVVRLFESDRTGDRIYYIMEYVQNSLNIAQISKRDLLAGLRLFVDLCEAVDRIHAHPIRSIFHRDLKPSNVLVKEEPDGGYSVKIVDFGIAFVESMRLTLTGDNPGGTLAYAAPEQLRGEEGGYDPQAADIYSLGCILLAILLNRDPMANEVTRADFHRSFNQAVAPLTTQFAEFREIVLKATDPSPKQRFRTAKELAVTVSPLLEFIPDAQGRAPLTPSSGLLKLADHSRRCLQIWLDPNRQLTAAFEHRLGLETSLGRPLMFLDFIGDLVAPVLSRVPSAQTNSTILIDLGDPQHVPGYNVLAQISDSAIESLIDAIADFVREDGDALTRALLRDILTLLRMQDQPSSLYQVMGVFENEIRRKALLSNVGPTGKAAAHNISKHIPSLVGMSPVARRLDSQIREMFSSRAFVNVVSQPTAKLSIDFIRDSGKTVVFDFGRSVLGRRHDNLLVSFFLTEMKDGEGGSDPGLPIFINGAEHLSPRNLKAICGLGKRPAVLRFTGEIGADHYTVLQEMSAASQCFIVPSSPNAQEFYRVLTTRDLPPIAGDDWVFVINDQDVHQGEESSLRVHALNTFRTTSPDTIRKLSIKGFYETVALVDDKITRYQMHRQSALEDDEAPLDGDVAAAVKKLVQTCAGDEESLSQVVRLAFALGLDTQAQSAFERLGKLPGNTLATSHMAANHFKNRAKYRDALDHCIKGLRLYIADPTQDEFITGRAKALAGMTLQIATYNLQDGWSDEIKDVIRDFVGAYPNFNDPKVAIIAAKIATFGDHSCEDKWEKALKLDLTGDAWNDRATWAKDVEKDISAAEQIYRRGIELHPENGKLKLNLAKILIENMSTDALRRAEQISEARYHLNGIKGQQRYKLGTHVRQAREALEIAIKSQPQEDQARVDIPRPTAPASITVSSQRRSIDSDALDKISRMMWRVYASNGCSSTLPLVKLKPALARVDPGFDHSPYARKFLDFANMLCGENRPLAKIKHLDATTQIIEFNSSWLAQFAPIMASSADLERTEVTAPAPSDDGVHLREKEPPVFARSAIGSVTTENGLLTGVVSEIRQSVKTRKPYGLLWSPQTSRRYYFDVEHILGDDLSKLVTGIRMTFASDPRSSQSRVARAKVDIAEGGPFGNDGEWKSGEIVLVEDISHLQGETRSLYGLCCCDACPTTLFFDEMMLTGGLLWRNLCAGLRISVKVAQAPIGQMVAIAIAPEHLVYAGSGEGKVTGLKFDPRRHDYVGMIRMSGQAVEFDRRSLPGIHNMAHYLPGAPVVVNYVSAPQGQSFAVDVALAEAMVDTADEKWVTCTVTNLITNENGARGAENFRGNRRLDRGRGYGFLKDGLSRTIFFHSSVLAKTNDHLANFSLGDRVRALVKEVEGKYQAELVLRTFVPVMT